MASNPTQPKQVFENIGQVTSALYGRKRKGPKKEAEGLVVIAVTRYEVWHAKDLERAPWDSWHAGTEGHFVEVTADTHKDKILPLEPVPLKMPKALLKRLKLYNE